MVKPYQDKNFLYPFLIWAIIFVWYIFSCPLFSPLRSKAQDFFTAQSFYFSSRVPDEISDVVIVAIDDFSLSRVGLKWPWKRSISAGLLREIASCRPKVIGLDIVYAGHSEPGEDEALASAFAEFSPIVLACVLREGSDQVPLDMFRKVTDSVAFVNRPVADRLLVSNTPSTAEKMVRNARNYYVDGTGHVLFSIDIALLAAYRDVAYSDLRVVPGRGVAIGEKEMIPGADLMPINYLALPQELTVIPAAYVLEGKINPDLLRDKIVLVGTTAPLIHDEHETPLGIFPGVSIIANSLVMMLSERFIRFVPLWKVFLLVFFMGVVVLSLNRKFSFGIATLSTFLILSGLFGASLMIRSYDIVFDYFTFFFLLVTAYFVATFYKYGALIYFENRVRSLAIRDQLTGFYTPRYFLLRIDRVFREKGGEFAFFSFVISNYKTLVLSSGFDEVKSLLKTGAAYLSSHLEKHGRGVLFCRLSVDTFGVILPNLKKETASSIAREFLEKTGKTLFKVKGRGMPLSLKCAVLHKGRSTAIGGRELMQQMEGLEKRLREGAATDILYEDAEKKIWEDTPGSTSSDMLDFLVSDVESKNEELEAMLKRLLESKRATEEAYFETIRVLIKALEEKDTYTQGHSERVARYARAIALKTGMSREESEELYQAGLLHDIGKIGVPDFILRKKERLTDEDYNMIRKHVLISGEILKPLTPFKDLIPVIVAHHERYDGTGYPYGLGGDMIPPGAQILAVADAFDAITCGRGYKKGLSVSEALQEMEKGKGTQFNPGYVDILKKIIETGELKLTL